MGDHLVLYVNRLVTPAALHSTQGAEVPEPSGEAPCTHTPVPSGSAGEDQKLKEREVSEEEEPLIQTVECRICQEEDDITNLETPCACSGSLKFAHRKCVQRWCNEKGDITCEICHQDLKMSLSTMCLTNLVILPHRLHLALKTPPSISGNGGWTISGNPLNLHDPRLLAMAAAERNILEAEYDEYASTNASGAAFCRSVALILIALLLLRHALNITDADGNDDDTSTFFSNHLINRFDAQQLFLLRIAGFLLPCYVMAWAISILQRRRQREEALTATEVAFVLQSGQSRGLQFTISGPARTPTAAVTPGPAITLGPEITPGSAVTPGPAVTQGPAVIPLQ
ncbi:hypothetical protein HHK36_029789 [Tetracentron sinense]|uniref:RING-CH-type domain-containing protein n=1 Tax=Tetracentron sinense TaxID=13715 RepID=A0A834YCA9_TETSI|nr:hypothetical protein HHK36_029789 [Tetracentron sinense]